MKKSNNKQTSCTSMWALQLVTEKVPKKTEKKQLKT